MNPWRKRTGRTSMSKSPLCLRQTRTLAKMRRPKRICPPSCHTTRIRMEHHGSIHSLYVRIYRKTQTKKSCKPKQGTKKPNQKNSGSKPDEPTVRRRMVRTCGPTSNFSHLGPILCPLAALSAVCPLLSLECSLPLSFSRAASSRTEYR